MNEPGKNDPSEDRAARRFAAMQLVRFSSLACVIIGIAIANEALPLPYPLGVVLAVGGLLAFFFAPPLLVKRWKAGDEDGGRGPP